MHKKKRGVSMMVSYALLVVIAIGLSAMVYPFLKARLPVDRVECPADLSISIEEARCNRADWSVGVKMINKGLFNITGVFIRFAEAGVGVRPQINAGKELFLKGPSDFSPLAPGEHTQFIINNVGSLSGVTAEDFVVEVQPAIFKKGALVPCSNKVITQTIKCISTIIGWVERENGDEYSCEGGWADAAGFPCGNVNDTEWTTAGTADPNQKATYYVNYSIEPGAMFTGDGGQTNWTVGIGNQNISLADEINRCQNDGKLQFKILIDTEPVPADEYVQLFCLDGPTWEPLRTIYSDGTSDSLNVYEEKMWWQLQS
ncbi:MAG: hypothetical protein ABH864_04305 [archaeon]